jgi:hypothetical protein
MNTLIAKINLVRHQMSHQILIWNGHYLPISNDSQTAVSVTSAAIIALVSYAALKKQP